MRSMLEGCAHIDVWVACSIVGVRVAWIRVNMHGTRTITQHTHIDVVVGCENRQAHDNCHTKGNVHIVNLSPSSSQPLLRQLLVGRPAS